MEGEPAVLLEISGAIAHIKLNRPQRLNAINRAMINGLRDALAAVEAAGPVRVIVFSGAGRAFCAGADMDDFGPDITGEIVRDFLVDNYLPLISAFAALPKPIIAALDGIAAGAGAGLALAADFRVMSPDSALLMAFINIALAPDAGTSWLLTRSVGYSRALEIAVEGKPVGAERCLELGLANKLSGSGLEAALQMALEWAGRLVNRPALAVGLTKQAIGAALQNSLAESLKLEAELQYYAAGSADFREGVAAFLERREAVFTGK